jgi:hypothetical protein
VIEGMNEADAFGYPPSAVGSIGLIGGVLLSFDLLDFQFIIH